MRQTPPLSHSPCQTLTSPRHLHSYKGFRPKIRNVLPKVDGTLSYQNHVPKLTTTFLSQGQNALNMASSNSRAYITPPDMPAFKRFACPSWELTEYRKTCHANIGKGSPYVRDLGDPSLGLKKIATTITQGEYFVEMQPMIPKRTQFTRGPRNS